MLCQCIALTTDAIVIKQNETLLIQRKREPFKGKWALPGGRVEYGETTESACLRELEEETALMGDSLKLIGVYSNPNRDPRKHTVSVVYAVMSVSGTVRAQDDAKKAEWFDIEHIPPLAFDHASIIEDAMKLIRSNF